MQDKLVQQDVHEFFQKLKEEVHKIIAQVPTLQMANEQIASMVGSKVAVACEGYVNDLCYDLSEQVEKEDYFQDPKHLNAFYRLDLEEKINEKYHLKSMQMNLKWIPKKQIPSI